MTEPKLGPNTGNRGKGRPKGKPNKINAALKDMILTALNEAHPKGGVEYLKAQAADNPTAFLTLVGKVLPLDVNAKVDATVVGRMVFDGLNG